MLGWHDEPQAGERLVEMAHDRDGMVRKEAIKALGWTDHPGAEEVLRSALADPHVKVRRWAKRGLETITQLKPLIVR
jgi:HEAT repeat protein